MVKVILKIGRGIVEKDKKLNIEALRKIIHALSIYHKEVKRPLSLIIVHSIGPAHRTIDDVIDKQKKLKIKAICEEYPCATDFCQVQVEINRIRLALSEIFLEEKLPFFVLHPSNVFNVKKNRIIHADLQTSQQFANLGYIPITSGGVVYDDDNDLTYLPGDNIVFELAEKLHPDFILFGLDIDGIFEEDPKANPVGGPPLTMLQELRLRDVPAAIRRLSLPERSGQNTADLIRKLDSTAIALEHKWIKKAFFFNLNNPERLISILKEETTISTIISP